MTREKKDAIVKAWILWMEKNDFNANQFSEKFEVPTNYLSLIKNGTYEVPTGNGNTIIADKYFKKIADVIGFDLSGKINWKFVQTIQAIQLISEMQDAKENSYVRTLIGVTGIGKTYLAKIFVNQDIKNNFYVRLAKSDNVNDFLEKILDVLKLPTNGSKSKKIKAIIKEISRMHQDGRLIDLIFDECEFMNITILANCKELIDGLKGKCGLVFLGAPEFLENLNTLKKKNKPGMPQTYRRLKFSVRNLNSIDTTFNDFFAKYNINNKELIEFLQKECDNYGELHDVLLPAMREAERLNEPLTEDLVRKMLNMPKN